MIDFLYSTIRYRKPRLFSDDKPIEKFIGVDTEAFTDGKPFIICTSLKKSYCPSELPDFFFDPIYKGASFVVYNMKYDSGALIYTLTDEQKRTLWEYNKCQSGIYTYEYIPHKFLSIKRGKKEKVEFWDIAQFYDMSLDKAAKKYLGEGKLDVGTKSFTSQYLENNRKKIIDYCIRDAELTARLAHYFKDKLETFGVECSRPYSEASLSFAYFKARCKIQTVWRFWTDYNDLIKMACESYQGGKFEITSRGSVEAYEYDIVSAYPFEMAGLFDIRLSKVTRDKKYNPDAVYSFLRCWIKNSEGKHSPHAVKIDGVQQYPNGEYFMTLTKAEYEYMIKNGFDITILDAMHLETNKRTHPYDKTIRELFEIKNKLKNGDETLYAISKKMINGIYGKMVQCIEQPDGTRKAGPGWNPIYGAIITANTRLRATAFQERFGDDCIGVHTDSVLLKKPLDDTELSESLGGVKFEGKEKAVLIACGIYDFGEKCKYRGFEFKQDFTWKQLLLEHYNRSEIYYPQKRVISWTEAIAQNRPEKINVFEDYNKKIDLNCDVKRLWLKKARARDLLHGLEMSLPKIVVQGRDDCPY